MNVLIRIVAQAVTALIRGLDAALSAATRALNWAAYELGFTTRRDHHG